MRKCQEKNGKGISGKGFERRQYEEKTGKNGVIMKKDWKSVDIKKNGKSFESGKNEKNVYVRKWKNSVLRNN